MAFRHLKQSFYHRIAIGPFEDRVTGPVGTSDIVLHLPVLEYYASQSDSVAEFGVRTGQSTVALVAGCRGQVWSYDLERSAFVDMFSLMRDKPTAWAFNELDTGDPAQEDRVPEVDLLFVDTLHTYPHVKKELAIHGRKARKWLAFHDTFTCGEYDLSGPDPKARGILPAINEFLEFYAGDYETVYRTDCCNGLWVLRRK